MLAGSVLSFYTHWVEKHPPFWNRSLPPHPFSARWLTSGKIWDTLSPRFLVLRKGFFWGRQVRNVQATFVSFHITEKLCQRAYFQFAATKTKGTEGDKAEPPKLKTLRNGSKTWKKLSNQSKENGQSGRGDFGKSNRVYLWPNPRTSSHFCRHAYVILYSMNLKAYSYMWI